MSTGPNFDGLHTQMFELGLKIRREVVGDAYVTKALENGSSEFSYAGQQLVTEYSQLFGSSKIYSLLIPDGVGEMCGHDPAWKESRGVFSVCNVFHDLSTYGSAAKCAQDLGILIALKSWPELGIHVRGALNNGLTEVEIREAVLHATIYCGVPAGVEAMKVAEATINDMVEKGEHQRELKAKFVPVK